MKYGPFIHQMLLVLSLLESAMTKSKWRFITSLLLLISCLAESQDLMSDTCSPGDPYIVDIEPDADVIVGAVLDLHHPGQGVFGCGRPSTEGVQYYEALRWSINALNQNSGDVSGLPVNDSFIPGVRFGKYLLYFSVGHYGVGRCFFPC